MSYGLASVIPGDHISITTDTCTEPFWQAAKEYRLTACQCGDCGTFRMPPTPFCFKCQSQKIEWPTLPGTGSVFSFAICNKSPYPDGAPGARLVSNIVGLNADDVTIGMNVIVDWNPIKNNWVLPIFRRKS
jgi:uncharacterized OB-fold protein